MKIEVKEIEQITFDLIKERTKFANKVLREEGIRIV